MQKMVSPSAEAMEDSLLPGLAEVRGPGKPAGCSTEPARASDQYYIGSEDEFDARARGSSAPPAADIGMMQEADPFSVFTKKWNETVDLIGPDIEDLARLFNDLMSPSIVSGGWSQIS